MILLGSVLGSKIEGLSADFSRPLDAALSPHLLRKVGVKKEGQASRDQRTGGEPKIQDLGRQIQPRSGREGARNP